MIYLKLEDNKELKIIQSALLYEGENLADKIKVSISDLEGWTYFLYIMTEDSEQGDFYPVTNESEIEIDNKFLTKEQNLFIWIEMRKGEQIRKSSYIVVKVNNHKSISEIITESEITGFEEIMREATSLYQQSLSLKEEIDAIVGDLGTIEDVAELNRKFNNLLNDFIELKAKIPTKISQLEDDSNFLTTEDVDTELNSNSTNPIANIAVYEALQDKAQVSDLENLQNSVSTLSTDIVNIIFGEQIVGKALLDSLGNQIDTTYLTKNSAETTYARKEDVDTKIIEKISEIIDGSPEALDTLNELAQALGDDPNFATTIATKLGEKANDADLHSVAKSGDYNDLLNKPTIDTETNSTSDNAISNGTITSYVNAFKGQIIDGTIVCGKANRDKLGNVINEYYATKGEIGDISTALDGIIAIQNNLLGVSE